MVHRRKPFSNKQKKAQLQAKRAHRREQAAQGGSDGGSDAAVGPGDVRQTNDVGRNKLTSQFDKLTRPEIEANKRRSMQPLQRLPPAEALTMSFDDAYSADVDIPVRPPWRRGESKAAVEQREEAYFAGWLERIRELRDQDSVSLYEKNLEVWRQLWRVVEISDVLLLVVDIRHPVLHFPPSLYRYAAETAGKPVVVVLNKTDLVAPATVRAWVRYFKATFPAVALVTFCCYRPDAPVDEDTSLAAMRLRKKRPRRRVYDSSQVADLFAACRQVCPPAKRALVDWDELAARYSAAAAADDDDDDDDDNSTSGSDDDSGSDGDAGSPATKQKDKQQAQDNDDDQDDDSAQRYLTLGLVGHPNVGKSTVINSILQRTAVSTSRTPGHTKHFQTIHVSAGLRLCDCPGLVFPCVVDRPTQVLAGLYNIAQVQEPYTAVMYLAERVAVERVLALKRPPEDDRPGPWSAWAICEAFAIDRGFFTTKAARPDVYRAALYILRWVLDGRILLSFKPPGFFDHRNSSSPAEPPESPPSDRAALVQHNSDNNSGSEGSESGGGGGNSSPSAARQSQFALLGEEDC
ncbi:hypothetical protein H4R18_003993 [Coemansia javaensis]|uniref:Guanine nucleotide-binding protein-like 1 n=1 Tax=Coemansia javaensis TaxID=2761396 RepID=A0A9W8LGV8_9FUNG|nr:hypothetical protein H4R18_003993 [Coemansia javaensis]